jgi:hypothetical protein
MGRRTVVADHLHSPPPGTMMQYFPNKHSESPHRGRGGRKEISVLCTFQTRTQKQEKDSEQFLNGIDIVVLTTKRSSPKFFSLGFLGRWGIAIGKSAKGEFMFPIIGQRKKSELVCFLWFILGWKHKKKTEKLFFTLAGKLYLI